MGAAVALGLAAFGAAPAEAQQGKVLKWGAAREIASLDPYSFGDTFTLATLNHVYEGLVRYTGPASELDEEMLATTYLGGP